jgi:hypothetical protein
MRPVETIFVDGHLVGHIYHDIGFEAFITTSASKPSINTAPTWERGRPRTGQNGL